MGDTDTDTEFSVEDMATERERKWDKGAGSKPGKETGVLTRVGPSVLPVLFSFL